jgi:three-Cys-motif partner protein
VPKLADDDPRKWEYSEHTRAKHEILTRYLGAWYSILGSSRARRLVILDGFAGRARYTGGESGSPVLIYEAAVRAVERGVAQQISILCSEANPSNFASLEAVKSRLPACEGVEMRAQQREFAAAAMPVAKWLEEQRGTIPTFAFVDPFGFTGVPLEVIKALMSVNHVEVLLTFMARDMSRFLTLDTVEEALNEFFGGDVWRACVDPDEDARTECLLLRYQDVVRPDIALYATPFRVFEDERQSPLYYLVHLTNHPLGMRRMKEAMVSESADMTFWPITLRPKNQLALDVSEGEPWPSLQKHLLEEYAGRSLTFEDLLNEDYPKGVWVEPQYRKAILNLEQTEGVPLWVARGRATPSGRVPRGLKLGDVVKLGER